MSSPTAPLMSVTVISNNLTGDDKQQALGEAAARSLAGYYLNVIKTPSELSEKEQYHFNRLKKLQEKQFEIKETLNKNLSSIRRWNIIVTTVEIIVGVSSLAAGTGLIPHLPEISPIAGFATAVLATAHSVYEKRTRKGEQRDAENSYKKAASKLEDDFTVEISGLEEALVTNNDPRLHSSAGKRNLIDLINPEDNR